MGTILVRAIIERPGADRYRALLAVYGQEPRVFTSLNDSYALAATDRDRLNKTVSLWTQGDYDINADTVGSELLFSDVTACEKAADACRAKGRACPQFDALLAAMRVLGDARLVYYWIGT